MTKFPTIEELSNYHAKLGVVTREIERLETTPAGSFDGIYDMEFQKNKLKKTQLKYRRMIHYALCLLN